jgi:hypothetical protein
MLKRAKEVLSKNNNISLLIEIHNLADGKNFYQPIMDLLNNYNFKIEFEKYMKMEKDILLYANNNNNYIDHINN